MPYSSTRTMRNNICAIMMVFVLIWALAVTALPSNVNGEPEISLREDFAPDAALLGINCKGSSECGGFCNPNIHDIKAFVDTIDDNKEFAIGQQIACHACQICSTCPDNDKRGICVFPQKLKSGEKVTGKQVKDSVNTLIGHGCKKCGSNPIYPGNNVNDGEITINFVRNFCRTGVCADMDATVLPREEIEYKSVDDAPAWVTRPDRVSETALDISHRAVAPESLHTLLGINCRGSAYCSLNCRRDIFQLKWYIDRINPNTQYSIGQQVACVVCKGTDHGICAFPQKLHKDEKISGATVQKLFQDIINHGCKGCGSAPLRPGNNVNDGELTVNYSDYTCQEGICPTASNELDTIDAPSTEPESVDALNSITDEVANTPGITPRDADLNSTAALLGINCRGSIMCNSMCRRNIFQLKDYMDRIGDNWIYTSGQQIACVLCKPIAGQGLCAFMQRLKKNEIINGATVKKMFNEIIGHGCRGCGSNPIHPGNNVNDGEITVNYVLMACGEGLCG